MRPGDVAAQHILWCVEQGLTPNDAIAALGLRWAGALTPSWNDVQQLVAEVWRPLPEADRETPRTPLTIEERFPVIPADARPFPLRRVA